MAAKWQNAMSRSILAAFGAFWEHGIISATWPPHTPHGRDMAGRATSVGSAMHDSF
jgi:hypothetical protein